MTDADKPVIKAIMSLRAANPAGYAEFCDALSIYAASARDRMLSAPLDVLPIAQGQAQSLRALYEIIRTAPELADKMTNARK